MLCYHRIIYIIGFFLCVLLLVGCTSHRLVPLSDGGSINPELQSATKVQEGVTVTVRASAWEGRPSGLERYITPFYVIVENNTSTNLTFDYEDLALFDEKRTQYNPLSPETVAQILRSDYQRRYVYRPYYPSVSIGIGTGFFFGRSRFSPFGFYSYSPLWYPPAYSSQPDNVEDVFTEALVPGLVRPKARLQGFVYFSKIPPHVKRVVFEIGYEVQGKTGRHEINFPFIIEVGRS